VVVSISAMIGDCHSYDEALVAKAMDYFSADK
jgi:hypothetical protein